MTLRQLQWTIDGPFESPLSQTCRESAALNPFSCG
jgi:lipopolysaccharide/colanic/teichoic acid biosynthesis glycosyltransferase